MTTPHASSDGDACVTEPLRDHVASPDVSGAGLLDVRADPMRYDGCDDHPDEVAGIISKMMPSGSRVLDVGCGTGAVAMVANRGKSNKIYGVEPDRERAAVAAGRGIQILGPLLTHEVLDRLEPFDVVVSSDVLEHVVDPDAFLDMLTSAVSDEGVVILSVPNVAHWSVRWALLWGRFDYDSTGIMDYTHLRWYTDKTLTKLCSQHSLKIVEKRYTSGVYLSVYHDNKVIRRLPMRLRRGVLKGLKGLAPRLIGTQHVLKLQKASAA